MSNEKHRKPNIVSMKPDLIKKLNNDIIELKNKDFQVDKMKKKIEDILTNNQYNNNMSMMTNQNNTSLVSHSHNFEDLISKAKQRPVLKTTSLLNHIKDSHSNTDKYSDLLSKFILGLHNI